MAASVQAFRYVALATDARGDTAVAWAIQRSGRVRTRTSVEVAFTGADGRVATRTLWRSGDALLGGIALALDARGELTVAWIEAARARNGATLYPATILGSYRSSSGAWSPAQTLGRSGPFLGADLTLVAAPDREVLLTWRAHTRNAPGVAAAWRRPGHGFGPETAVSRAASAAMLDPTPVFDSGGAAHVYGTVDCGRGGATCATMVSAGPGSHRFRAPLLIAPAPAEFPVVSFSGPGQALIAWEAGDFEGLEPYFAAPYARVMAGGSLTAPVALQTSAASVVSAVGAVAANGGGGTVSWAQPTGPYPSSPIATLAVGDESGRFSAPRASAAGWLPVLRDGLGDILLRAGPAAGAPVAQSPVAVQPTVGAIQVSPVPPVLSGSLAGIAATQPVGPGAAVAWVAGSRLETSTWRP